VHFVQLSAADFIADSSPTATTRPQIPEVASNSNLDFLSLLSGGPADSHK
jgi:hypothetical protein